MAAPMIRAGDHLVRSDEVGARPPQVGGTPTRLRGRAAPMIRAGDDAERSDAGESGADDS
jgi:hypothetical protein